MTADVKKKTAPVWFQARLGGSFDLHVYYSIANIGKKLDFFNSVEATTIHPPPPPLFVQCYVPVSESWRYIKMVWNTLNFNVMSTLNSKF